MIIVDSTTADNHGSTFGTGTNDLGNDTRVHTTLYSGQVEGAFGLFANISSSNCSHKSSVEDDVLSNCDTKEKVDDETSNNCNTCLAEDESVR